MSGARVELTCTVCGRKSNHNATVTSEAREGTVVTATIPGAGGWSPFIVEHLGNVQPLLVCGSDCAGRLRLIVTEERAAAAGRFLERVSEFSRLEPSCRVSECDHEFDQPCPPKGKS